MDTPKTVQDQSTKEGEGEEEKKVQRSVNDESPSKSKQPTPEKKEKADKGAKKSAVKGKARQKNNVRKMRMERMMSKAELARRAGLSTLTIDRVEKGMNCRMDTKRKILEALGLTPSDRTAVFGDDD
jgi:DNA-binding XRE family transcriptional regulator